jgi:tetratricopeptide (TPR) repeat protein/CHAT domain-containing protein
MKYFYIFVLFFYFPQLLFSQNSDSLRVARVVDSLIQVSRGLMNKREFPKAIEVLEAAKKTALEKWGKMSVAYGNALYYHSRALHGTRDYAAAEKLYVETLDIQEKILGPGDESYLTTLSRYGTLFSETKQFERAEPIYLKVRDSRAKYAGKEHPDYASSLHSLAILYMQMGKRSESEKNFLECIDLRAKILGKEHADYASSLHVLGVLYATTGEYKKAMPRFLEARNIRGITLGKEHTDYIQSTTNLSKIYVTLEEYDKALPLVLECIAISEKKVGKRHRDYGSALQSLASIRFQLGEYEQAESLCKEVADIFKEVYGAESVDYAFSLVNLAVFYRDMGNFEVAEQLLLKAKSICAKAVGKMHPDYASMIHLVSTLHLFVGNFEESVALETEAIEIYEKLNMTNHPDLGWSLNALGVAYQNLGKTAEAEASYLRARAILESALGKESSKISILLHNMAAFYQHLKRYEAAEKLYFEALASIEKTYGNQHAQNAITLDNLGSLYLEAGRYTDAEQKLREAMRINETALSKTHPEFGKNLNNLAKVQIVTGRFPAASQSLTEANELHRVLLTKSVNHLSERELGAMLKTFSLNRDLLLRLCNEVSNTSAVAFDQSLFYKGFLLNAGNRVRSLVERDSSANTKFTIIKSLHRRLAAEYAKPIAERKNVDTLENRANELEKELTRKIAGYGEALRQVKWQEVQTALKPNEAAIEFVHYNYWHKRETDSVMYAALVLRPGMAQPLFVSLFEEKQLAALLDPGGQSPEVFHKNCYAFDQRGKSLYQLVWGPLEAPLKGVKKVFCSPSGLLYRLSLADLPAESKANVSDIYDLSIIGSTRQLVISQPFADKAKTALFFGGIQYDMDSTAYLKASGIRGGNGLRGAPAGFYADSTLRGGSWKYLPGTEKEAIELGESAKAQGYDAKVLLGFTASEDRFKALDGQSPRILHLATHGFFFPDAQGKPDQAFNNEPVFKYSDNPLLRAGLILAGGNHAWSKGHPLKPDMEDGILTAYEIAHLDLSKTELVVLSACETGLGDIQGNEGVYGLQRAFKIAGAKNILMSLWQVPDQQTARFMGIFYKKWLHENLGAADALQAAKKQLKDRGYDPFYWAGFVLVE